MSAEEWIEGFAKVLGVAPPSEEELARVLELASVAAHSSERRAAPVACWLAGATGRPVEELIDLARQVEARAATRSQERAEDALDAGQREQLQSLLIAIRDGRQDDGGSACEEQP
jgi:Domain of unknown function (DUF6457)